MCDRTADPITSNPLGPPQAISIGESLYDLLSSSPDASTSDLSKWTPYLGGAPANVCTGLARLGTASAMVSAVGEDDAGRNIRAALETEGVNVDGVQMITGRRTRRVFVRRDENREAHFVGFDGNNKEFADAVGVDIDKVPGVLFYAAKVLVTGTLALAFENSSKVMMEMADMARTCLLDVVVDVNWRPVFWEGWPLEKARQRILEYLCERPGADIIKVNVEEIGFLFNDELANVALEKPEKVLEAFGGRCRVVIVTAAEKGASYAVKSGLGVMTGYVQASTAAEQVVDTTGAGDAFLAGFLSEMLKLGVGAFANEENAKQVANFASVVSGIVVKSEGPIQPLPSRDDVESILTVSK